MASVVLLTRFVEGAHPDAPGGPAIIVVTAFNNRAAAAAGHRSGRRVATDLKRVGEGEGMRGATHVQMNWQRAPAKKRRRGSLGKVDV